MSYADIINQKKKDWQCDTLMDGAKAKRGAKIPFTSPLLTWETYGGIPRDVISEFFGENGGGKSTTAIDVCKNAIEIFKKEHEERLLELEQKVKTNPSATSKAALAEAQELGPKKVLYIDLEHSFDEAWSKTLGIDDSEIDIMQPPNVCAEDVLQTAEDLICTDEVGLMVLDSIPTLVTRAELEKKYGERTVSALAGLLTIFMRKIVPICKRYHCTLLLINQIRDNMDNPFVVQTPGGKAVKFYCSLRMQFQIGDPVDFLGNLLPKKTENPAGYVIKARLVKQKTAPFDRKEGSYFLMCHKGIIPMFDYAQLAINKYGLIVKKGGWFTFVNPDTGEVLENEQGLPVKANGLARVYQYLEDNPNYFNSLKDYILKDINGDTDEDAALEETNEED